MKVLSKVLWAVSINEDHSQALNKVVNTAGQFGSEMILLHVLRKEFEGSSFRESVERRVSDELEQLAGKIRRRGKYKVQTRLAYGSIAERILDVAGEEDVNVILLNRGRDSEITGGKLGTNARSVARMSAKPVAIISNLPPVEDPGILVPVDFSGPSTLALNSAIIHAKKVKARLTVITVFEPVSIKSPRLVRTGINEEEENAYRLRNLEREFKTYLEQFDFSGVELHQEVLSGIAGQEIISYSRSARILYMGSTGKSGLRRAFLGSVSEKVLNATEASVVLVKSEEMFRLRITADLEDISKHFERGNELVTLGFYQEAVSQYNKCLSINELYLPSIGALAALYEKLGETAKQEYFTELSRLIMRKMTDRKIEEEIRRTLRSVG